MGRGSLGLLVASTNLGKSTLILNLALSAASSKTFAPLLTDAHDAKRVMYIDGEASKKELQNDLKTMLTQYSEEEKELVKDNFFIICDAEINDEPLDLVNSKHLDAVKTQALEFNPDLIVVDTLSALMTVEDENDNAIVKKEVMQPLKALARQTNSAVLLLHHTGKYSEGFSPGGAYKGRGASAFGALARLVITLERSKEDNQIKLVCAKTKGETFPLTILELDTVTRWFSVIEIDSSVSSSNKNANYGKVVTYVLNYGKPVKTGEVVEHFNGQMSYSTVDKMLRKALAKEDLVKAGYGYYSAPLNLEGELALGE